MIKSLLPKVIIMATLATIAIPTYSYASDNRFQFQKTDEGILRFDGETGRIDKCTDKAGKIDCILSDDDRTNYEQEIKALKEKITSLEHEKNAPKSNLPSKQEIDQAYGIMKYLFDKFNNDFKPDQQHPKPGASEL